MINYDPPANIKGYVHRVGRTARAGKAGTSYTLLRDAEVHHFKSSMAKAGKAWQPLSLPHQAARMRAISWEYQYVLERLGAVLDAERSGTLLPTASREECERVLDLAGPAAGSAAAGADDENL